MAIATRVQRDAALLEDVGMWAPVGSITTAARKAMLGQYPFGADFNVAYGPTPRSGGSVILPVVPKAGYALAAPIPRVGSATDRDRRPPAGITTYPPTPGAGS